MSSEIQSRILRALFVALKPLTRALLRAGVGYREFSDVAKAAFIHEASREFGLRGRPTNISRVAIMTGINRKEVKRLRAINIDEMLAQPVTETPLSIVLSRWNADPRYLDRNGNPKVLEFDGNEESFVQLVSEFAGDVPVGAMKVELKRVGAIEELPDKRLSLVRSYFVPSDRDQRLSLGLIDVVSACLSTLAYNCQSGTVTAARFHRVASIDNAPINLLPSIAAEANKQLGELATSFDSYLVDTCESDLNRGAIKSGIQAGIGLFYYEREQD